MNEIMHASNNLDALQPRRERRTTDPQDRLVRFYSRKSVDIFLRIPRNFSADPEAPLAKAALVLASFKHVPSGLRPSFSCDRPDAGDHEWFFSDH